MYILRTLCQLSPLNDADWTWDVAKIELYRTLSTLTVILFLLLLFLFFLFFASDSNSKNWNCLPGFVVMPIESLLGWRKRGDLVTPCQESFFARKLFPVSTIHVGRNSWNSLIYGTTCGKKRSDLSPASTVLSFNRSETLNWTQQPWL